MTGESWSYPNVDLRLAPQGEVRILSPLPDQVRHAVYKCAENGGDVQLTLRAAEWSALAAYLKAYP